MRALHHALWTMTTLGSVAVLALTGACHSTTYDGPYPCDGECIEPPIDPNNPQNQTVVTSEVAPPPISGGTLLVTRDGSAALVADPDRDRVLVVDLASDAVRGWFWTDPGAEPGRAVEDGHGHAFVAMRRTGQLVTVDLATAKDIASTYVCPSPRGVAFDASKSKLHVACAGGELVTLSHGARTLGPSRRLEIERTLHLDDDLRDVVIQGDRLLVSHFRSAVLDTIDAATGQLVHRTMPSGASEGGATFSPTVAWRMAQLAGGTAIVVHQESKDDPILVATSAPIVGGSSSSGTGSFGPGGGGSTYGGFDCGSGIVHSRVTFVSPDGVVDVGSGAGSLAAMPVPVDVAAMGNEADPAGVRVAIVAAGNGHVLESDAATLLTNDGCLEGLPGLAETPPDATATDVGGMRLLPTSDEPVAVAYTPKGELVVQIREPAALEIHDPATGDITARIPLGGGSRLDTAHQLFHSNPDARSSTNIACASCHPEGRDDGHVWQFVGQGARRTMSLASFSTTTAPFHWSGDLSDVSALMDDVFVGRMGGQPQSTARKEAISAWLDRMPSAPRSSFVDTTAAARGKQLFEDPTVGCATCHSGPKLTNNVTVAVGTGSALQVPSLLGLGARAPYMHDGCAPTLRDRFLSESCGGGEAHGHTAQLSSAQIDDLVAYLSSL